MPLCRSFLALLLAASVSWGAELRNLKGEVVKGEVVSISDKEVVIAAGSQQVKTPVDQILFLDLAPAEKPNPDVEYSAVELNDGSVLACKDFRIKGKQVELDLLGGPVVKMPLAGVANVLVPAQVEKYRKDWAQRVTVKRKGDALVKVVNKGYRVYEGVLGEGDEKGETIDFALRGKTNYPQKIKEIHGLIFLRTPDPNAAPVICKVLDKNQSVVMASSVVLAKDRLTVKTPSGAEMEYPLAALARLDYSRGKIVFLSDLEPAKVIEAEVGTDHWRRDKNLDFKPISLGGVEYARGLALHAHTELEYDLKGDYREFRAVVGIDDHVGGLDGITTLRIEADGTELASLRFSRRDKVRHQTVIKDVRNVQKLRIIVDTDDLLKQGQHLDLADAKVSK